LYPVVLIPSIYFIDSTSGLDLEVTGGQASKEKILESIQTATEKLKVKLQKIFIRYVK
jgi:hypothetical protein